MRTIEEIKQILAESKDRLISRYKIREIGIFGSYTQNKQRKHSDIDILVQFEKPVGFFKFLELEEELSKILDIKVDLVTKDALRPHIGERILKEVVYV
jgi:uncharacterized protein